MPKKTPVEYAIVDIETTGGAVRHSCMTEIAIRIFDGQQVIEHYDALINPQRPIPPAIVALTGINNEMVSDSPVFSEIAKKVYTLLNGRVFVAHNVNFDYSFVKQQLSEAGFNFSARRLCTVRLARKIQPGLTSYSLGRICDYFSIDNRQRHRAAGDAEATVELFTLLLSRDSEGHIQTMLNQRSGEQKLPPHLNKEDFEALPHQAGVYYFMDKNGKVVYVGKAKDLKKRVVSHFTGHNPSAQRQLFLKEIHHIGFELCGTELMALLLECQEIRRLWPRFNRALKEIDFKYGLFLYEDQSGYLRLGVGKRLKHIPCLHSFDRLSAAVKALRQLRDAYALDPARCIFNGSMLPRDPGNDPVPYSVEEPAERYNQRVQQAVDSLKTGFPSFILLDQGRNQHEKSCIWVESGNLQAMGYVQEDSDLTQWPDMKAQLKPCNSNPYMMLLINEYVKRHSDRVYPLPDTGNPAFRNLV